MLISIGLASLDQLKGIGINMILPNHYLMMDMFRQIECTRRHQAEMYRLSKICRRKNLNWITHATCQFLIHLGRLILKWGEHLQHYSLADGRRKASSLKICDSGECRQV